MSAAPAPGPVRFVCVGLNWKTPLRIRERLAIEERSLPEALGELKESYPEAQFSLLSTCNRTEIYAICGEPAGGPDAEGLERFLARRSGMPPGELRDHLYVHLDSAAIRHLLEVASGLDSLVLGEDQILGQVKRAYDAAVARQTTGPDLHLVFQSAFGVAKRVRAETDLGRGKLSIGSAAVDYLRGVFDSFGNKTVLVIGAGKMAELALRHLMELGPGAVVVCNRSPQHAHDLAARFGGSARPLTEIYEALVEADIVISSTGADEPIVKAQEFAHVLPRRRGRLLAIVDIAVPRDFEAAIGELDDVLLWDIDDLEKIRHETLRSRERELAKALAIVEGELEALDEALALRTHGSVIGLLEQEYQRIVQAELEWLLPQLNGVSEEGQAKIRHFAHRLKNKFLHPPKAALRAEGRSGRHYRLFDAFRKLFGLEQDV